MKRILLLLVVFTLALGTWANGQGETKDLHNYKFSSVELEFEPASVVQVEPSASIIAIFEDSDNDEDGDFPDAEPYFYKDADRNMIPSNAKAYIDLILSEDTDDVLDLIRGELKAACEANNVEKAYMIIGTHMFTCTLSYLR